MRLDELNGLICDCQDVGVIDIKNYKVDFIVRCAQSLLDRYPQHSDSVVMIKLKQDIKHMRDSNNTLLQDMATERLRKLILRLDEAEKFMQLIN